MSTRVFECLSLKGNVHTSANLGLLRLMRFIYN